MTSYEYQKTETDNQSIQQLPHRGLRDGMKRWTNGLPGATTRLGAIMALRGLSASQPWMRADTHDGPEQSAPHQRPDTLMQLSRSSLLEVRLATRGRAIHFGTFRTCQPCQPMSAVGGRPEIEAGFNLYQSARLSCYDAVSLSLEAGMRRREFVTFLGGAAAATIRPSFHRGEPRPVFRCVG